MLQSYPQNLGKPSIKSRPLGAKLLLCKIFLLHQREDQNLD